MTHTPTPFNIQAGRVILLTGKASERLWEIVKTTYAKILGDDSKRSHTITKFIFILTIYQRMPSKRQTPASIQNIKQATVRCSSSRTQPPTMPSEPNWDLSWRACSRVGLRTPPGCYNLQCGLRWVLKGLDVVCRYLPISTLLSWHSLKLDVVAFRCVFPRNPIWSRQSIQLATYLEGKQQLNRRPFSNCNINVYFLRRAPRWCLLVFRLVCLDALRDQKLSTRLRTGWKLLLHK